MYPHRIRLRGPWECDPAGLEPRRVTMPGRWADAGLSGSRGMARFTRRFGYPGKADPEFEHIWLTCDGCTGCAEVHLNGKLLSEKPGESFAFDVTSLMAERNQLEVVIDGQSDDAGLWGEVALEIRKDAYLANVRLVTESCPAIVGEAVGTAPQPLELYTLLDNRNADYRTIMPTPAGTPFRIELNSLSPTCQLARVELVHISSIWYGVEVPIRIGNETDGLL
jgi:hypothetical protein